MKREKMHGMVSFFYVEEQVINLHWLVLNVKNKPNNLRT